MRLTRPTSVRATEMHVSCLSLRSRWWTVLTMRSGVQLYRRVIVAHIRPDGWLMPSFLTPVVDAALCAGVVAMTDSELLPWLQSECRAEPYNLKVRNARGVSKPMHAPTSVQLRVVIRVLRVLPVNKT